MYAHESYTYIQRVCVRVCAYNTYMHKHFIHTQVQLTEKHAPLMQNR